MLKPRLELKAPAQTFGLAVNNVKVEPKLKLRLPKARIKAWLKKSLNQVLGSNSIGTKNPGPIYLQTLSRAA